jgi:hypothetical protein
MRRLFGHLFTASVCSFLIALKERCGAFDDS